jgi:hypothetical protein
MHELTEFVRANGYSFTLEGADGHHELKASCELEPDLELGAVVGDIVHNARSALDLLVADLTSLPIDSPDRKRTQFPILDRPDTFEVQKVSYLNGVADEDIAIIEQYQPFQADDPLQDPLQILSTLNNADKHRHLHIVSAVSQGVVAFVPAIDGKPGRIDNTTIRPGGLIQFGTGSGRASLGDFQYEPVGQGIITREHSTIARLRFREMEDVAMHTTPVVSLEFEASSPDVSGLPVYQSLRAILVRVEDITSLLRDPRRHDARTPSTEASDPGDMRREDESQGHR